MAKKMKTSWGKFVTKWAVVGSIWGCILLALILGYYATTLPDVHQIVQNQRRPSIVILDRQGEQIARYGDTFGHYVQVKELPPHFVQALLATEDRRFYSHFGVDVWGTLRAVVVNMVKGKKAQGASTITQQLARNLFLTPQKNWGRKIQEAMLAIWLERTYTKDQILTAYLNRVYLGSGTYGVDAAAEIYFHKSAKQLDLAESAIIAGLLKAPSKLSPINNPDLSLKRANLVLECMKEAGYLQKPVHLDALPSTLASSAGADSQERYFADYIVDQLVSYVSPDQGDMIVYTTLDLAQQRVAKAAIQNILAQKSEEMGISEAAFVSMDLDGAIKVMLGGRDYQKSQFNRVTQAYRQPGSVFKPLIFLAGLQAGLYPDQSFEDKPIKFGKWQPRNIDRKYRGVVTLEEALALSINTVSVQVLQKAGLSRTIDLVRSLGITSPMTKNLTLALGTSEVNLLELTGAFTSFANGGRAVWPYGILKITDKTGRVLYQRQGARLSQVIAPDDLTAINQMLRAVVSYGTGKTAKLTNRTVAGKSGTSQDYHDAWFIGYTQDQIAGVWLGNDNNAPMKKVTGGNTATLVWKDFMMGIGANAQADSVVTYENSPDLPEETHEVEVTPMESEGLFQSIIDQILSP